MASVIVLATCWRLSAEPALLSEFPFEFREGLVWVRVTVRQSADPLNFLIDSGAGASVINLRTAKRLGVRVGQRVDVHGVGGSAEGFWSQRLAVTASGIALPKEYLAVDLAELAIPTTTTTVRIGSTSLDSVPAGLHRRPIFPGEFGLLGNGLLARFERVTFDAKAGKLVLQGSRAGF